MNFWKQSIRKDIELQEIHILFFNYRNALNVLKDDLLVKIEELSK